MLTARDLGNHSPVERMDRYLGGYDIAPYLPPIDYDSSSRLVTGGFHRKDLHCIVPSRMSIEVPLSMGLPKLSQSWNARIFHLPEESCLRQ